MKAFVILKKVTVSEFRDSA